MRVLSRALGGWPPVVEVALSSLGPVSLTVARIGTPSVSPGESVKLMLAGHRHQGRLTLDAPLALAVVAAVLQAPAPAVLRALGPTERGVLAAAVAAALAALGLDSVQACLEEPDGLPPDALEVALVVQAAGALGQARLALPQACFSAQRPWCRDPSAVDPLLVLELARTRIPLGELYAAEVGDAVVFEGSFPPHATDDWCLEVRTGSLCFSATLTAAGLLGRTGPLLDRGAPAVSADERSGVLSPEGARALASAAVEVVAELGRVTVKGAELVGLVDGAVLPLGRRAPMTVELRVADRVFAVGEVVTVDDELAVRIIERR